MHKYAIKLPNRVYVRVCMYLLQCLRVNIVYCTEYTLDVYFSKTVQDENSVIKAGPPRNEYL